MWGYFNEHQQLLYYLFVSYLENPCLLPHLLLLYADCMASRRSEMREIKLVNEFSYQEQNISLRSFPKFCLNQMSS